MRRLIVTMTKVYLIILISYGVPLLPHTLRFLVKQQGTIVVPVTTKIQDKFDETKTCIR